MGIAEFQCLGKDTAAFVLDGICPLYPPVNTRRLQTSLETVWGVGPALQMFTQQKELFAVVYKMLQDRFVNKSKPGFVQ